MNRKAKNFRALALIVMITGLGSLTSCEKYIWSPPQVTEEIEISFTEHLLPFCVGCHTSWDSETAYEKLSDRVDTVTPESSTILSFHSSVLQNNMIQVNDTLVLKAADVVKLWASQGAENN